MSGRRLLIVSVLLALLALEGYRAARFYADVSASRDALLAIKGDLDIANLQDSREAVEAKRQSLLEASDDLGSARSFVKTDPLLAIASLLPGVNKQARGLKTLVEAANESVRTGVEASDIALAFAAYERDPQRSSIDEAVTFLRSQEGSMAAVDAGLQRLRNSRDALPEDLFGPLRRARADLDSALVKLDGLVEGYQRADRMLPDLLGYNGARRYLVLPQNDTELFPSGGLISSYGIATFENGRLVTMDLEYFGTLFDRWQKQSGGEYIEPPGPLKNYLKQNVSWALGEAGWYPDFPTTAQYARSFVSKGGAPATDGTIAIDLKFIGALLGLLGPVYVPEYAATVTAANLNELSLELTRDEAYIPGTPRKAFLSYLARGVLNQLYTVPKEHWVDLLQLLDRMGRERHFQLNFRDPNLQTLAEEYGFDGGLVKAEGDFLLIADSSVNSTKLNLILRPSATLDLQLMADGSSRSLVSYEIENPFPQWQAGKDPRLVKALMIDGVYGCYLRIYAAPGARLMQIRLDGQPASAEEQGIHLGRGVFGRFFPVMPGSKRSVQFLYQTPGMANQGSDGLYRYSLYVQKEAGTGSLPFDMRLSLPQGGEIVKVTLDGKPVNGSRILTDLRTDHRIEVIYRPL